MEIAQFRELLSQTQSNNTESIKLAESTLLEAWNANPQQYILYQLQLLEQDTNAAIVQFVSIQIHQRLGIQPDETYLISKFSVELFNTMKESLSKAFFRTDLDKPTYSLVCNTVGMFIADILTLNDPNHDWPDALTQIAEWAKNPNKMTRYGALTVFKTIVSTCPTQIMPFFSGFVQIVQGALVDQESPDSRISALKLIVPLLPAAAVKKGRTAQVKALAPLCLNVLSDFISVQMFDECISVIKVFSDIQSRTPSFFADILDNLLQGLMMIVINDKVSINTVVTEELTTQHPYPVDLRKISLEFVIGTLEHNRKAIKRNRPFQELLVKTIILFMMEFDCLPEPDCYEIDCAEDVKGIKECCRTSIAHYCSALGAGLAKKVLFPFVGQIMNTEGLHWKAYYCALMTLADALEDISSSIAANEVTAMFLLVFPIITQLERGYETFKSFTGHQFETRRSSDRHSVIRQVFGLLSVLGESLAHFDIDLLTPFIKDIVGVCVICMDREECVPCVNELAYTCISTLALSIRQADLKEYLPLLLDKLTQAIGERNVGEDVGKELSVAAVDALRNIFAKAEEDISPSVEMLFGPLNNFLQVDPTDEDDINFQAEIIDAIKALVDHASEDSVRPFILSFSESLQRLTNFIAAKTAANSSSFDIRSVNISMAWPSVAKIMRGDFKQFLHLVIPDLVKTAQRFPNTTIDTLNAAVSLGETSESAMCVPIDEIGKVLVIDENDLTSRENAINLLKAYALLLQEHFIEYVPICWTICVNILREANGIPGIATEPLFEDAACQPYNNEIDESKGFLARRSLVPVDSCLSLIAELEDCLCTYIYKANESNKQKLAVTPLSVLAQELNVIDPVRFVYTTMQLITPIIDDPEIIDTPDAISFLDSLNTMLAYLTPFRGNLHRFPPSVHEGDAWPEDASTIRTEPLLNPLPFAHFIQTQINKTIFLRHEATQDKHNMEDAAGGWIDRMNDMNEDDEEQFFIKLTDLNSKLFTILGTFYGAAFSEVLIPSCTTLMDCKPFDLTFKDETSRIIPLMPDISAGLYMLLDYVGFPTEDSFITANQLTPTLLQLNDAWIESFKTGFQVVGEKLKDVPEDEYEERREELDTDITLKQRKDILEKLENPNSTFTFAELMEYQNITFIQNTGFGFRRLIEMDFDWMSLQVKMNSISPPLLVSLLLTSINTQSPPPSITSFPNGQAVPPSFLSQYYTTIHQTLLTSLSVIDLCITSGFDIDKSANEAKDNISSGVLYLIKWLTLLSTQINVCLQSGEAQFNSAVGSSEHAIPFSTVAQSAPMIAAQLDTLKATWLNLLPFQGDSVEAQFLHDYLITTLEAGDDPVIAGMGFGPKIGQQVLEILRGQAQPTEESFPAIRKLFSVVLDISCTDCVEEKHFANLKQIGLRLMQFIPSEMQQEVFNSYNSDRRAALTKLPTIRLESDGLPLQTKSVRVRRDLVNKQE
ncbi:hypothetical protein BLNAU_7938 [Blattamonas nauphoetae]|uniref:IPO4/5-like TPR repeats domain-containing protein n=1 Tax=Blattamonas nauphoetae TaxID=2049346 RepID=A0ABQ9Y033_9EUKA|nr:hypothetical protein BLNAU_7938 [Blattamonas nauphoetae]